MPAPKRDKSESRADASTPENTFLPLPPLPPHWHSLAHAFVHQARSTPNAMAITDSLGSSLTYQKLLVAAVALAEKLLQIVENETSVGILLPPSAGAAIANIAVALAGKVSINLNYTTGQKVIDQAISAGEIKHVISSQRFLEKLPLKFDEQEIINLDEVRDDIGIPERLRAWTEAQFVPETLLGHFLPGLTSEKTIEFITEKGAVSPCTHSSGTKLDQPVTIMFTSGSTGNPKGVVLSNRNLLSNIHAIHLHGQIQSGEIVLGVIPFFHSFGLTMTLWATLCLGESVVYHYSPLEARKVGELCEKHQVTTLVSTPTMMSNYVKRCPKHNFKSLRNCILGGEKLKLQQRLEIESVLPVHPTVGYGLAESAPVVSCNVPGDIELPDARIVVGTRSGTVGLPIPGTAVKIVEQKSGKAQPTNVEGMIYVKGPQVMMGYLKHPEETRKVKTKGWFETGDIGYLDKDGFLTITGRRSQFSKIAGEMVSHLAVEDELVSITGIDQQAICVTSAPDEKRGEKLVVVYSDMNKPPHTVVSLLRSSNIPRLWIPQESDFIRIDEMPVLGNGKLDLRTIHDIVSRQYAS